MGTQMMYHRKERNRFIHFFGWQPFVALALGVLTPSLHAQSIGEEKKIVAADGDTRDEFGKKVAIGGGKVVVGAMWTDEGGTNTGSVYAYDAYTGSELHRFYADDFQEYATLGSSVDVDGNVVAAGCMNWDGFYAKQGAAYLFDLSTGDQLFRLDPDAPVPSGQFGSAIAIDGGIVAVGAHYYGVSGFAPGYVFIFDASTGGQKHVLSASDAENEDEFGYSVDIDKRVVAVGAPRDDDNGNNSGSVYLFDAATGVQTHKLMASDGAPQDRFGWSVAIHNGLVAVGAYLDDDNGNASGSVYLFDATTGDQLMKITAPDGSEGDWFGFHVALDEHTLLASSGRSGGYTFDLATGVFLDRLSGSDTIEGDRFGYESAIWEGVVVVGAFQDDNSNGTDAGSAYIFDISCPADLDGDGDADHDDFIPFLAMFMGADPGADWNHDSVFDYFDVALFIAALNAGCPHS